MAIIFNDNSEELVINSDNQVFEPSTSLDVYSYPSELNTTRQPHSVIFYINARSTSAAGSAAFDANGAGTAADWRAAQSDLEDQYSAENRAKSEQADTVLGGAAAVAALGATVAAGSKLTGDNASALAVPLLAAGTAFAAGAVTGSLVNTSTTLRLLSVIQLHVQSAPSAKYTANWNEESLGAAVGLLASGRASLSDILGGAEYLARGVIGAAANVPKELGLGQENIGAAIEATSKKVSNPYKEQLFKSMGFRKFGFEYRFMPKNPSEFNNVMNIIKLFKYHMHPDKGSNGFFLIYPSEFNIEYRYMSEENQYVSKISSCVLTDMQVTYGSPDGTFNTIQGTQGAPNDIQMNLSFTELETLTADRIKQGGL